MERIPIFISSTQKQRVTPMTISTHSPKLCKKKGYKRKNHSLLFQTSARKCKDCLPIHWALLNHNPLPPLNFREIRNVYRFVLRRVPYKKKKPAFVHKVQMVVKKYIKTHATVKYTKESCKCQANLTSNEHAHNCVKHTTAPTIVSFTSCVQQGQSYKAYRQMPTVFSSSGFHRKSQC